MRLFGRSDRHAATGVRTTALVVAADAPPHGAPSHGVWSRGTVRILVDIGSGPVEVAGSFAFRGERWLVRGMDVPVTIDPAHPEGFEVDWEAVPSVEDRVAAGDPALADPIGAELRVARALGRTQADSATARSDRFKEALHEAARTTAPAGKLRAVVLVATIRGHFLSEDHGRSEVVFTRNSAAVLAVNVPGRAPYAVFVRAFKFPRTRPDVAQAGLPALVSASDPQDVAVLWDEVPSIESQIATRMTDAMAAAQAQSAPLAALGDQIARAAGAIPTANAAALEALAPQMRQLAAANAQHVLRQIQDPAMRKLLLEQYRAAGIALDEGDEQP